MTQAKVVAHPLALPPRYSQYAGRTGIVVKVNRIRGITYRTLAFLAKGDYEVSKADKDGRVYAAFRPDEIQLYPG